MRIRLGIVSETSDGFLNQAKLCLYSLRTNAGALRSIPVTLITNSEPLSSTEMSFFEQNFSPIDFVTSPRLGAIPHTSKLNVFYAIDPSSYDILLYLDCDTVIRKPLDGIADPIIAGAQFVCRRGGETDRNRFVDFTGLVGRYWGQGPKHQVRFEGASEWPMFNTGVFLATPDAVRKIRRDAVELTYALFNEWQRCDARETLPLLRKLYRRGILSSRKPVLESWPIEQGAVALACIKAGVSVAYLDETYNSWGNLDFHILHCFKSAYAFDRSTMFSDRAARWLEDYSKSDLRGKTFLARTIIDFQREVLGRS